MELEVFDVNLAASTKRNHRKRHYCCICSNYRGKTVNEQRIQLHRFPAKTSLRRIWLRRIKLIHHDYVNGPNDLLCSIHFESGRKRGDDTVPSIFHTKTFKTKSVSNHDYDVCSKIEIYNDIADDDFCPMDGPTFVTDKCSNLYVSVMLHDYCGKIELESICTKVKKKEETLKPIRENSFTQAFIPPIVTLNSSSHSRSFKKY